MLNKLQENVPLAPYTTFQIGGPARFFMQISEKSEIEKAFSFAREKKLPLFILGGGSNVLISDQGFDGLVLKLDNRKIEIEKNRLVCGAGALLSEVVTLAKKEKLSGLEWATGIPGTVGGALAGNASAYDGSMADNLEEVEVLDFSLPQVTWKKFSREDCQLFYRESAFKKDKNLMIFSATFSLNFGKLEEINAKMEKIIQERSRKHPPKPSAGSFFKNPQVKNKKLIQEFEEDQGVQCRENKIPAGWLIDQLSLRQKKIGGAMISEEHSNFIINTGTAKAEDVIILASLIKQKVRNHFGVQLEEEVQFVGF